METLTQEKDNAVTQAQNSQVSIATLSDKIESLVQQLRQASSSVETLTQEKENAIAQVQNSKISITNLEFEVESLCGQASGDQNALISATESRVGVDKVQEQLANKDIELHETKTLHQKSITQLMKIFTEFQRLDQSEGDAQATFEDVAGKIRELLQSLESFELRYRKTDESFWSIFKKIEQEISGTGLTDEFLELGDLSPESGISFLSQKLKSACEEKATLQKSFEVGFSTNSSQTADSQKQNSEVNELEESKKNADVPDFPETTRNRDIHMVSSSTQTTGNLVEYSVRGVKRIGIVAETKPVVKDTTTADLNKSIESLQKLNATLSQQLLEAKTDRSDLINQVKSLEAKIDDSDPLQTIERLSANIACLKTNLTAKQNIVTQLTKEQYDLRSDIFTRETTIKNLKATHLAELRQHMALYDAQHYKWHEIMARCKENHIRQVETLKKSLGNHSRITIEAIEEKNERFKASQEEMISNLDATIEGLVIEHYEEVDRIKARSKDAYEETIQVLQDCLESAINQVIPTTSDSVVEEKATNKNSHPCVVW